MGIDTNLFLNPIDNNFLCAICQAVFDSPVQLTPCEHMFCSACINDWLVQNSVCPIDQAPIVFEDMHPVPRIVRVLLADMKLRCPNYTNGCNETIDLENLDNHKSQCKYDPSLPPVMVACNACEREMKACDVSSHDCIAQLIIENRDHVEKLEKVQSAKVRSRKIGLAIDALGMCVDLTGLFFITMLMCQLDDQ